MKKISNVLTLAYFSFWLGIFSTLDAHAYIDPTTTAMLTQIVAGIFISLGLVLGIFRRKIMMFFKNLKVKALQKKIAKEARSQKDN